MEGIEVGKKVLITYIVTLIHLPGKKVKAKLGLEEMHASLELLRLHSVRPLNHTQPLIRDE